MAKLLATRQGRWALTLAIWLMGQASSNLQAGPLEIEFDHIGAGAGVTINYHGQNIGVFAGQFFMHFDFGPGFTNPGPDFPTFCVDPDHWMTQRYIGTIRSTNDGLNHGGAIAYLYNTYGNHVLTPAADNILAAALQIAMWDEVADGGDGLNNGSFRFIPNGGTSQAIFDLANLLEAQANQHADLADWFDASLSGNGEHRGQSVLVPGDPVPEPTTFAIFSIAIVGYLAWRRKSQGTKTPLTA